MMSSRALHIALGDLSVPDLSGLAQNYKLWSCRFSVTDLAPAACRQSFMQWDPLGAGRNVI